MQEKINILLVEDNPEDADWMNLLLKNSYQNNYTLTVCDYLQKAAEQLKKNKYDVIITDITLPDSNGLNTFIKIFEAAPGTPVIVLTGLEEEQLGISTVKHGAQDFLIKGKIKSKSVWRSINYSIQRYKLLAELTQAQKQLQEANLSLEKKVTERTDELNKTIFSLVKEAEQRKKYEAEIKKLSLALSKAENSIIITDNEGKIEWVNEGFVRLTGYTLNEVSGTSGEILRKGQPTGIAKNNFYFNKLIRGKKTISYESQNFSKSGREYWVYTTLTPVLNDSGAIEKIIAVDSNITHKKEFEKEVLDAKKIAEESARAKESFLAHMSHEIRTPINAFMGILQLIQDSDLSEKQKKYINAASFAAQSLLHIINDILYLSKISSGKIHFEESDFSIGDLINETVNSFSYISKEKKVVVSAHIDSRIPDFVSGDAMRLNQILSNLLSNSVKFTSEGTIFIKAKLVTAEYDKICINFEVSDAGIGIPQDKLKSIFNEFEQADIYTAKQYGGTGLGLAIVKRLVDSQKGDISVSSELGKGTTFSVTLDFKSSQRTKQDEIKSKQKNNLPQQVSLEGIKILLVEDNELNQMVANEFLKKWKVIADLAPDGSDALKMLEKNNYDLILMDIQMPKMNGYQTAEYIRKNFKGQKQHVPILAMTAHAFREEQEKCRHAGMNDYISKPLSIDVLYKKICCLVQR